MADLESNLKAERTRLRTLTTEQDRMQRDKQGILSQLQRTESVSTLGIVIKHLTEAVV